MKYLGVCKLPFPEVDEEAEVWKPTYKTAALASTVLAVAKTRIEGCWRAYVKDVPGLNHDDEWRDVVREGTHLPEDTALSIFPMFKGIPYAR